LNGAAMMRRRSLVRDGVVSAATVTLDTAGNAREPEYEMVAGIARSRPASSAIASRSYGLPAARLIRIRFGSSKHLQEEPKHATYPT